MTTPIVRGDPKSIAAYYEQTWFDYRTLWLNSTNRAMHFGYWDDLTSGHAESLINMNKVLAARAEPKAGDLVLDAGCGVGGTAMWMAERYKVRVAGVTVTPAQVVRATRYSRERGLEGKAIFGLQDYCHLAFADETFDIVYGLETINYAVDKRDFVAEAYRVLKPGGRLVVQDGFKVDRTFSDEETALQESWLAGWMVPNLASLREFARWTAEAGFEKVTEEDCTDNVRKSCRRLYRVTMGLYPMAAGLRKLGFRSEIQHANVRAARDQWLAMKRGLWGYGIVSATKPKFKREDS